MKKVLADLTYTVGAMLLIWCVLSFFDVLRGQWFDNVYSAWNLFKFIVDWKVKNVLLY